MYCSSRFSWVCLLIGILVLYGIEWGQSISSPGAVSSFSPGAQYIMLTFNTPNIMITSKILDILLPKKVRATFFVNGADNGLIEYRSVLERMAKENHEIALYGSTHNHVSFTRIPRDKIVPHLAHAAQALQTITGHRPKFVRAPLGQTNAHINEYIKVNASMSVALWSIDAGDNDPSSTIDSILHSVTDKCTPGDVVLFHATRDVIVTALPGIIDNLYQQGYEMLTLSQVSSYPDDSPHR